jgi:aryl-alcohol dehydrogenase-like predicted oxidoreductase
VRRLEGDYVRFYKEYGYGTTTWSPLASGMLSGKYNKGIPKGQPRALKGYGWLKNSA